MKKQSSEFKADWSEFDALANSLQKKIYKVDDAMEHDLYQKQFDSIIDDAKAAKKENRDPSQLQDDLYGLEAEVEENGNRSPDVGDQTNDDYYDSYDGETPEDD